MLRNIRTQSLFTAVFLIKLIGLTNVGNLDTVCLCFSPIRADVIFRSPQYYFIWILFKTCDVVFKKMLSHRKSTKSLTQSGRYKNVTMDDTVQDIVDMKAL
jgi:hypothetical protein